MSLILTFGVFASKVEQFVLTSPHDNESWEELERMIGNAEELCKALDLSYQVRTVDD